MSETCKETTLQQENERAFKSAKAACPILESLGIPAIPFVTLSKSGYTGKVAVDPRDVLRALGREEAPE